MSEDHQGKGGSEQTTDSCRMAKFSSLTFEAVPEEARLGEVDLSARKRTWLPLFPDRSSAEIQFCVFHWFQAIALLCQRIMRIRRFKCQGSETSRQFHEFPSYFPPTCFSHLLHLSVCCSPHLLFVLILSASFFRCDAGSTVFLVPEEKLPNLLPKWACANALHMPINNVTLHRNRCP